MTSDIRPLVQLCGFFDGLNTFVTTLLHLTIAGSLHTQRHYRVHNIMVVLLQRLDGLLARHASLGHDQLDVLALHARLVDLLVIVLVLFFLLSVTGVDGLALAVVMAGVVVACVTAAARLCALGGGELRRGVGLCLGVEVLDLCLAEDAAKTLAYGPNNTARAVLYIQVLLAGDL